jgi:hypothetical protein
VPALPSGCPQVEVSLASYSSRGHPSRQRLFSSGTQEFLPGGRYELSATVAPPPSEDARPWLMMASSGFVVIWA